MRYTLKDYQADAVRDVLSNLAEAREMFHNPRLRRTSQFALTATTGAGKTVMAAAAIEARMSSQSGSMSRISRTSRSTPGGSERDDIRGGTDRKMRSGTYYQS